MKRSTPDTLKRYLFRLLLFGALLVTASCGITAFKMFPGWDLKLMAIVYILTGGLANILRLLEKSRDRNSFADISVWVQAAIPITALLIQFLRHDQISWEIIFASVGCSVFHILIHYQAMRLKKRFFDDEDPPGGSRPPGKSGPPDKSLPRRPIVRRHKQLVNP